MTKEEKTKKNASPIISQKPTKKNDFIEIKFTGYANEEIFDSNIPEDLKKINKDAKPEKLIVMIGQGMVVKGLDNALEGKNLNEDYEVEFSAKEGFGERDRSMLKTISLTSFTEQKIDPRPGMVLALDNKLVKIIAVSGARVTADFNNPLSGKAIKYEFKIIRKVTDKKEKSEALLKLFFRFTPDFEIKENRVVVKLQKELAPMIELYKEKFKELSGGLDLEFEEASPLPKEPKSAIPKKEKNQEPAQENEASKEKDKKKNPEKVEELEKSSLERHRLQRPTKFT